MGKKEIEFRTKNFAIKSNIPLEAIKELCEETMINANKNSALYKDTVEDICEYTAQLTSKKGGVFCHKPHVNIKEASCIKYINEHSLSDYMSVLVLYIVGALADNDKTSITDMESHYEHIFYFWMGHAFERKEDVIAAEFLLVLLSDSIGWLRGKYKMGESRVIKKCLHIAGLIDKHDKDLTEEETVLLIKTGNVRHRLCDVCGCELAVPDRGIFGRGVMTTMACTICTNTKKHMDFLAFVEDLRKKHDKPTVEEILDTRLDETWEKGSIFTYDKWVEHDKKEKK